MSLEDEVRQNLESAASAERIHREQLKAKRRVLERHPETVRRELRELARFLTARIKPTRHRQQTADGAWHKSPPGVLVARVDVLLPEGSIWRWGQIVDLREGIKGDHYDLFLFGWTIHTTRDDDAELEAWPVRAADDMPNPHVSVHQMMVAVATTTIQDMGGN